MKKKYIIVVSIVIVLWCAFMGYRHHKKKEDTGTYRQKASNQVTEIAKKSPRAGLAQMGMALKRYYAKKQAYPSSLMDLYPEYLPYKSLIEEIDWYYEPRGDDFYLSKTLVVGNKRMVASIDKGLRPQTETGVMLATPTAIPKAKGVKKPGELAPEMPGPSAQSRLALAGERFLKILRQRQMDVTSVSLLERNEARIISTVQPEIVLITEPETGSGAEFELSYRYLVWKDKNGVLGFSNTQYPDADRLSICAVGRWYNVKTPTLPSALKPALALEARIDSSNLLSRSGPGGEGLGGAEKGKKDPEMIAASFDRHYLVWKDKHGTLGFGNLQYPERDPVSVFQTDGWVSIERPRLDTETGPDEDPWVAKTKSAKTIASDLSTQYLVWKDKHGTMGFGNVQYPEGNLVSAFETDDWINIERPCLVTEAGHHEDRDLQEAKSGETIASELSTRYLVWKDKHGTLGFGNVQYPEISNTSHIHVNGSWEPVVN